MPRRAPRIASLCLHGVAAAVSAAAPDATLRRYVEYTKIVATAKRDGVGAGLSRDSDVAALAMVTFIILKVVPAFQDFYGTLARERRGVAHDVAIRSSCARSLRR